jgi:DNA-directed RNA polymerase subunit RPC12/RpoP
MPTRFLTFPHKNQNFSITYPQVEQIENSCLWIPHTGIFNYSNQRKTMNHQCPKCESTLIEARHIGRKVGGTTGAVAGAAVGAASAAGGAEIGASLGLIAGPAGALVGGIAGALLGGLLGGSSGCIAGAKVGDVVDGHVLNNYVCNDCQHQFHIPTNEVARIK